ncbi:MAG: hypothetical protein ACF8CY_06775 [Gimesia chilikensis]
MQGEPGNTLDGTRTAKKDCGCKAKAKAAEIDRAIATTNPADRSWRDTFDQNSEVVGPALMATMAILIIYGKERIVRFLDARQDRKEAGHGSVRESSPERAV